MKKGRTSFLTNTASKKHMQIQAQKAKRPSRTSAPKAKGAVTRSLPQSPQGKIKRVTKDTPKDTLKGKSHNNTSPKDIYLVIPNIRSAHNVGSLIRTADAMNVRCVYICGYTPRLVDVFGRISKPQKEIIKTALGAEQTVQIEYRDDLRTVVKELRKKNILICGLEQHAQSINISSRAGLQKVSDLIYADTDTRTGIALVVGEEVSGLPPRDIALMEYIIEIPMYGKKESMNVSVAGGIALHQLRQVIDMSVDAK